MDGSIERIPKPSREDFRERYLLRNRPVVLQGVADRWPAASRWTPEYLKAVAGEQSITVHHNEEGSFFDWYVHHAKRVDVRMPFGELVDRLVAEPSGKQYYMTEYRLRLVSPELLDDVDFGDYFDPAEEPYEPMLFLGRDTSMPLHYHGKMEAFLCQLTGVKRVTLYSPDQYRRLYPGSWWQRYPLFSRIDGRRIHADTVDTTRFPAFVGARPIELTLHPGEMLFIPVHWWHLTSVEGFQVSVSHFFRARLGQWTFPLPGLSVLARETKLKAEEGLRALRSHARPGRARRA